MTWNYSGNPSNSDRDSVRFLIGDTCDESPLVSDEEIAYALTQYSKVEFASALILRALAAKFSRVVTERVGEVSSNCSDIAKAYRDQAKELDPGGITNSSSFCVLPSFGGLSISEKEELDSDTDAVQPIFRKGMNDIPGGPDDADVSGSSESDLS